MDVAAMSMTMASHHVQSQASLAVMSNVKNVMEQQGQQLVEMLQQPQAAQAPHPSLGGSVDLKV